VPRRPQGVRRNQSNIIAGGVIATRAGAMAAMATAAMADTAVMATAMAATVTAAMVVIIDHSTTAMVAILMLGPVGLGLSDGLVVMASVGRGAARSQPAPLNVARLGSRAANERCLYSRRRMGSHKGCRFIWGPLGVP
jgi:hypothetical protein